MTRERSDVVIVLNGYRVGEEKERENQSKENEQSPRKQDIMTYLFFFYQKSIIY